MAVPNIITPKGNQVVERIPHNPGCGARLETGGFEMLCCDASPLGEGPNDTLYQWVYVRCSAPGCGYETLVRDDWLWG